jgi:hypothetical protein
MKRTTTLFLPPLVIGVAVAVFGLSSIGHERFSVWQWCLAVLAILVIGLQVGALLNLAVFAPVYWLLGRLRSKQPEKETGHEHKS